MIATFVSALALNAALQEPTENLIPWQKNLVIAKRGALKSNMLIFAQFQRPGEAEDVQVDRFTYQDALVQVKLANFVPVKVIADEDPLIRKLYGPFLESSAMVLDPKGTVLAHFLVPVDPVDLVRQLNTFFRVHRRANELGTIALNSTADRESQIDAAINYLNRFQFDEAKSVLELIRRRGIPSEVSELAGQAYLLRGGSRTAVEWYETALKGQRDTARIARIRLGLATAHARLKNFSQARNELKAVLDLPGLSNTDRWIAEHRVSSLPVAKP